MPVKETRLTDYTDRQLKDLTLSEIAYIIYQDWKRTSAKGIYLPAEHHLDCMGCLDSIEQNYGADRGAVVVSYFLANAQAWKGEVAKAVKAHLNALLKSVGY